MKCKYVLLVLLIIFSGCKEKNRVNMNTKDKNDSLKKNTLALYAKSLILPFSSDSLNYSHKDGNGYFIYDSSFKSNSLIPYTLVREVGEISLTPNKRLIVFERKPMDDENTEPIVTLYLINDKNECLDSLNIHSTIQWEGFFSKRFIINKDLSIHIIEQEQYYDLESNSDSLIINNKETKYKISNLKIQKIN